MKKFKKFYIALLGGILALGVGTGSLVSSVRPTAAEAADPIFTIEFTDSNLSNGTSIGGYYFYSLDNIVSAYAQVMFGSSRPTYNGDGYIQLYAGNQFYVSTTAGTISQIEFTFNSGSGSNFVYEYRYMDDDHSSSTSFEVSGDTLYFGNVTSFYIYVGSSVQIKQIDVTITGVVFTEDIPDDAHIVNFRYLQINNGYDFTSSLTSGYITVSADSGSGTMPKYYTSGYIALSAGNQIQISTSAGKITKVYFTFTSTDDYSVYDFDSYYSQISFSHYSNTLTCDSTTQLSLYTNASMQISQIGVILTDLPEKAVVEKTIDINLANVTGYSIISDLEFGYITLHHDGEYSHAQIRDSYVQYDSYTYFNLSTSLGVISKIKFNFRSGSVSSFASWIAFSADTSTSTLTFNGEESISLYLTSSIQINSITVTLELNRLEEAIYWADSFYNGIVCDNGVTPPDKDAWAKLEEEYAELTSDAKAYFANNREKNADQRIENAILKYDYIINKYGTDNYTNFIGRTPEISSANTISSVTNNIDYVTIIAVIISVLALTSIGAFIIVYRRKRLSAK